MAQTIKLKRSATQGAAPTTSNLALGEVAINTYDGKMYIKKDVGGTESIVEIGGSGANTVSYLEAGMIEYEYTATSNQTTFSGSDSNSATLSYTANSIMVFLNGVLQDDGVDYTATNGTSVVFSSALTANDEVRIVAFTNVTTSAGLNNPTKLDAITTVNAQAAYSLTLNSSAYTPSSQNALIVSLNGITQEPGDSFTISGSTITFSPALVTGDVVDYIVDMGRAVTIGEYSGDLAVGGELEVTGDIIGDLRGATLFKAQAGESLAKGDVVYISGISGNTTVVSKADADDAAKMPAFGLVAAAASSGNPVDIYTFGELSGLDTSSFSEGDELFVSTTAGTLTNSAPTGESSKLQKIAKVTRSDNSAGSVFIMGAGRSNAVPNLDDGDIFIGNASNQAVTASLNTKIEDYLDGGTSTPVFSTINSGNITTTGYIAGPSTFTIDPAAVGDNTGTLVVAGNLQVDGTTTTINSTTMTVDDLNITLASGAANAAAANGAGITVDGASATLTYNSTPDAWSFNKNLGIGTASPDADLEIRKDNASGLGAVLSLTNSNSSGLTGNSVAIGLSAYAHTTIDSASYRGAIIRSKTTAAGNGHSIIFETSDTSLVPAERMIIDHNGNVGIGTDSPADELEIEGVDPAIRWDDTSAGGYARLEATNGSMVYEADQGNTVANSTHIFKIDSDEKMRITGAGSVGIGTDSPGRKLHLKDGQIKFENTGTGGWAGLDFSMSNGTYDGYMGMLDNDGKFFIDVDSNGNDFVILQNGNVGIGTNDPQKKLEVAGDIQLDATDANIWLKSGATGTNGFINWTFNTDSTVYNKIGMDYDTRATTGFHIDAGYPITIDASVSGNNFINFQASGTTKAKFDNNYRLILGDPTLSASFKTPIWVDGYRSAIGFGSAGSGVGGSVGAKRLDSANNLRYSAYFAYDCHWDHDNGYWVSHRDSLDRKFILQTGYHDNGFLFKTFQGTPASTFTDANLTELARIDNNGLKFNGDTAAANALNDYEEGTFTPGFAYSAGNGNASFTFANATGRYTKIGNVCYYAIDIRFNTFIKGTASGQPQITNLPFTPANYGNYNRVQTNVTLYQYPYTTNDGYFPGGSPQQQGSINRIDLSMNRPNLASVFLDDPDANSMIFASGYYYTV